MKTVQSLLYSAFQTHANRKAIIDPNDGSIITYSALYDQASAVAGYLHAKGIRPGDYVAIALSRSSLYIVAETACLLFGYGAVLMDAAYPQERIAYAAGNAGAKLIIDDSLMAQMLTYPHRAQYQQVPEDFPAVVIYTSGSTGNPKGIAHDQASLGSAILRYQALLKTAPEDTEGILSPFTFIVGCIVFLNPLCAGASMTVIPREVIGNPLALAAFIDKMHITQLFMPPSVLKLFKPAGNSLRLVTTGSERVSDVTSCDYSILISTACPKPAQLLRLFPLRNPIIIRPSDGRWKGAPSICWMKTARRLTRAKFVSQDTS